MSEPNPDAQHSCCSPSRAAPTGSVAAADPQPLTQSPPDRPATARGNADAMVSLPGGVFVIGSNDRFAYPEDGEDPREIEIGPFRIDPCAVSNAAFAEFVSATGYVTEAETFGWSFVFGGFLPDDFPHTRAVAAAPWWRQVYGADWRHPEGPQSDLAERSAHPVVHVSFNDALSFCAWAGKRLPTEAEWEFAARGGLERAAFPWGDDFEPGGEHRMNVWQGAFPNENTCADGYAGTCPVDAFPPNGYGLHNATGNVWEWTADRFDPTFRARDRRRDPTGPATGTHRVQKGGSHLCHASYCRRYRVAARQGNEPNSSTGNLGFRCAADVQRAHEVDGSENLTRIA
ncbi:MAG: formylglycine-generating enzyme family protein [Candidatus Limnocylindria bacterium]